MNLAQQIELHLLDRAGWVPVAEIEQRFGVTERQLRADRARPGLLDHCAVSSTRNSQSGFIHHRFLPTVAWLPIKHRLTRHAIAELRKIRRWERARRNCTTGLPATRVEAHSGQALLNV